MITAPTTIVDLIAGDLAGVDTIPTPATTVLYAEPALPQPSDCPALAIWTEQSTYELLTGGLISYRRRHAVSIAWYTSSALMAETGGSGDPATVQALDQLADTIEAQLTTYANGLPGTSNQVGATIATRQLEPQSGSIWRVLFTLTVEDDS